jgi:hypothetical protein
MLFGREHESFFMSTRIFKGWMVNDKHGEDQQQCRKELDKDTALNLDLGIKSGANRELSWEQAIAHSRSGDGAQYLCNDNKQPAKPRDSTDEAKAESNLVD